MALVIRSGRWVSTVRKSQRVPTDMTDRVCSGPHRRGIVSNRVLAHPIGAAGSTTRALSATISGTRGRGRSHVQLLLMTEQEIAARKAAGAVGTLKGLLLRMGTLMALQVLQSRKGATASSANVRPRLISLGGRDIPIRGLAIGLDLFSLLRSY